MPHDTLGYWTHSLSDVDIRNILNGLSFNYREAREIVPNRSNDRYFLRDIASYLSHNHLTLNELRQYIESQSQPVPEWILNANLNSSCVDHTSQILESYPAVTDHLRPCRRCSRLAFSLPEVYTESDFVQWCQDCSNQHSFIHSDGYRRDRVEEVHNVFNYHGYDRRMLNSKVDFTDPHLLGLEVETYIPFYNSTKTAIVLDSIKNRPIVPERDGSLHNEYGVEFVMAPISFYEIKDGCFIQEWAKVLQSRGCSAWNAGVNYGIHISVNAKMMTELHVGKFCHFINSNKTLCEKIAGRSETQWSRYTSYGLKGFQEETAKYLAASRRSKERVEVRIFRSSLSWTRIKRNCEFVHAVLQFSKYVSTKQLTPEFFLVFLDRDENKTHYRLLREFLGIAKVNPKKEVVNEPVNQ